MTTVEDLLGYLGASPSPYHAVDEARRRLVDARFEVLEPTESWPDRPGRYLVARDGALVAWEVPEGAAPSSPFRIVGAHTDSPNLRLKPRPDVGSAGWRQLGVEVYGGALWNSWLDRDLGLSGRVSVAGRSEPLLVKVDEPLARIPQLAIHLDRGINENGLRLNPQVDLTPVWGVGSAAEGDLARFVADALTRDGLQTAATDIVAWDLMFHDLTPPGLLGRDRELIASGRLDNLLSCWAATSALASREAGASPAVAVACLYDHEEIGSTSATGADGTLLASVLERTVLARGGDRADYLRAVAGSWCVSADMAHATHPNRPERHEPAHPIAIDGGPVIKVNANQRYATDSTSAAVLVECAERAGVTHQLFVGRNDQPCGSTIGPLTAARLGVRTVDVGVAQLSMHSARELCGANDPLRMVALLDSFFDLPPIP